MVLRIVLFTAIGGACGYGWYRAVGCPTGACPFTRNPYVSTLWGALIGIMLGHWMFGAPFTATSMIGFIALALLRSAGQRGRKLAAAR